MLLLFMTYLKAAVTSLYEGYRWIFKEVPP
jgi:hypothetical protein